MGGGGLSVISVMPSQDGTHDKLQRDRFWERVEALPHRGHRTLGRLPWIPSAVSAR